MKHINEYASIISSIADHTPEAQRKIFKDHAEKCRAIAKRCPDQRAETESIWHELHDDFLRAIFATFTDEQKAEVDQVPNAVQKRKLWTEEAYKRHRAILIKKAIQKRFGIPDPLDCEVSSDDLSEVEESA